MGKYPTSMKTLREKAIPLSPLKSIFIHSTAVTVHKHDVAQQGPSSYLDLPHELHYEIVGHLDYPSLRNLNNTSRFFRQFINQNTHEIGKKIWIRQLTEEDNAGHFDHAERQPCYRCVRLRLRSKFPTTMPHQYERLRGQRQCIECEFQHGIPGKAILVGAETWTRCRSCKRARKACGYDKPTNRSIANKLMCRACGTMWNLTKRIPVLIIELAEMGLAFALLVWVNIADRHGSIVDFPPDPNNSGDDDDPGSDPTSILRLCIAMVSLCLCC